MLHVASFCTPCCMLLDVVACCCAKFETVSLLMSCWLIALLTVLGPRTLITHGLQRLMDCILPKMHCRSQTCWELLHPFAHHCQHCWRNNVGSCCASLHAAFKAIHPTRVDICSTIFQWQEYDKVNKVQSLFSFYLLK